MMTIIEILALMMTQNMISEIGPELGDFADAEVLVGGDCFSAHIDHLHDHIDDWYKQNGGGINTIQSVKVTSWKNKGLPPPLMS